MRPDTASEAFATRTLPWAGRTILDACTVKADYGQLLILTDDGALHGMHLDTGATAALCTVGLPELPPADDAAYFGAPRWRMAATLDGNYVAIVADKGRQGLVVALRSGAVTMHLDGGDYHEETVPFSACFVRFDGRDVLIHRTAWNRLDGSDPASGALLTARHIASNEDGANRPLHYLDYFHGQLRPSPDSSRIFDDGWVWHPASVPRAWSVTEWLGTNPWESEDGASVVDVMMREAWTTPACWIDNHRLAVWSLEEWDEDFEKTGTGPHVRIVDATVTVQSPDGLWPMDPGAARVLDLFSDGHCLYVVDEAGTTVWDIAARLQLTRLPGFVACLQDAERSTLIAIGAGGIGVATRLC